MLLEDTWLSMPIKTEYLLFCDASRELLASIQASGAISLSAMPPISITRPTVTGGSFLETMFNASQVNAILDAVRRCAALSYSYDPTTATAQERVMDTLIHAHVAFQLVKPTRWFGKYWFRTDDAGHIESMSNSLGMIHLDNPLPYLWYQQHNTISPEDVELVRRILPRLLHAFSPAIGSGSWTHPSGSVHRALVLFAQGYLTEMFGELRQFLWAMGLDCLFSSKIDKRKRGAQTIDQRLRMLLGAEFAPYKDVLMPGHQTRPEHKLWSIARDVFALRNAVAHGLVIPDAWLTPPGRHPYVGYAYQLAECTEILLRRTLLIILNDQRMFDIFVDSRKLDRYFG
jgi:hypothetical protein